MTTSERWHIQIDSSDDRMRSYEDWELLAESVYRDIEQADIVGDRTVWTEADEGVIIETHSITTAEQVKALVRARCYVSVYPA